MTIRAHLFHSAALAILACTLAACSAQVNNAISSPSANDMVTLTSFQGTPKSAFTLNLLNNLMSNNLNIAFSGMCPVGGVTMSVFAANPNRSVGAFVNCNSNRTFNWKALMSGDGSYLLTFVAKDKSGAVVGTQLKQNVDVVTVLPAAPQITNNGGVNFTSSSSHVLLQGTFGNTVAQLKSPDVSGLTVSLSGQSFQVDVDLTQGHSKSFSFIAYDKYGNASAPARISIAYQPSLTLRIPSVSAVHLTSAAVTSRQGTLQLKNLSLGITQSHAYSLASRSGHLKMVQGISAVSQSFGQSSRSMR